MCVCKCMCVCVRESERERKRERIRELMRERMRERDRMRERQGGWARRLTNRINVDSRDEKGIRVKTPVVVIFGQGRMFEHFHGHEPNHVSESERVALVPPARHGTCCHE